MKKLVLLSVIVNIGFMTAFCEFENVRAALDAIESSLPHDRLETSRIMEFGGTRIMSEPCCQSLFETVSNDWNNVLLNMSSVATNQTERCLILMAGLQYGWDFYFPFADCVADECINGRISAVELDWYECASMRPCIGEQFYYRYNQPAVSNLMSKFIQGTGNTNKWVDVMSGVDAQIVEELIQNGVIYLP